MSGGGDGRARGRASLGLARVAAVVVAAEPAGVHVRGRGSDPDRGDGPRRSAGGQGRAAGHRSGQGRGDLRAGAHAAHPGGAPPGDEGGDAGPPPQRVPLRQLRASNSAAQRRVRGTGDRVVPGRNSRGAGAATAREAGGGGEEDSGAAYVATAPETVRRRPTERERSRNRSE